MKQLPEISQVLTEQQVATVEAWIKDHKTYVELMCAVGGYAVAPSDSEDIGTPSLWKHIHWKWYFLKRNK